MKSGSEETLCYVNHIGFKCHSVCLSVISVFMKDDGYGLHTLSYVLRVVDGEILLQFVPVFGLAGLDGLFCCIPRFVVLVLAIVFFVSILFRL